MELVLFYFLLFFGIWSCVLCSHFSPALPIFLGTRANHLKRRLSSIKRLEIFKGVFSTHHRCVCARPLSHLAKMA